MDKALTPVPSKSFISANLDCSQASDQHLRDGYLLLFSNWEMLGTLILTQLWCLVFLSPISYFQARKNNQLLIDPGMMYSVNFDTPSNRTALATLKY